MLINGAELIWYHNSRKKQHKRGLRWAWIQVLVQRHLALGECPRNVLFWRPQIVPLRLKGSLLLTFVVSVIGGTFGLWDLLIPRRLPLQRIFVSKLCCKPILALTVGCHEMEKNILVVWFPFSRSFYTFHPSWFLCAMLPPDCSAFSAANYLDDAIYKLFSFVATMTVDNFWSH